LSAPTIEYVVEDVARWHQALAYEMPTAPRPEYTMPTTRLRRVSSGKFLARFAEDQSSTRREQIIRTGMLRRLL
jgi:hypothetical protein